MRPTTDPIRYLPLLLVIVLLLAPSRSTSAQGDGGVGGAPDPSSVPAATLDALRTEIEARMASIEADATLSPEVEEKALQSYRDALAQLDAARTSRASAVDFRKQAETADATIAGLEADPIPDSASAPGATANPSSEELDRQAKALRTQAETLRGQLAGFDGRLERIDARPAEIEAALTKARERIAALDAEAARPPPGGQPATISAAQAAFANAERFARLAEIESLEAERLSADERRRVEVARRAAHERRLATTEAAARTRQDEANARRTAEDAERRERTEAEELEAAGKHPAVRELAEANADWSRRAEEIGELIRATTARTEAAIERKKTLETEFQTAKDRVEAARVSEVVGIVLRRQRNNLPERAEYRRESASRKAEIVRVELESFDVEDAQKGLEDIEEIEAAAARRVAALGSLPEAAREPLEREIVLQLEARREVLDALSTNFSTYLRALGDLDAKQSELVVKAQEVARFLDEHLVWIRSARPLDRKTFEELFAALAWVASPTNWLETAEAVTRGLLDRAALSLFVAALILGLLFSFRRLARRRETIRSLVGKVQHDSVLLTIEALAIDAIAALPWPLALYYVAWLVRADDEASDFAKAMAVGATAVSVAFFSVHLFRRIVADGDVAERHFRWHTRTLARLRKGSLLTYAGLLLPCAFVVSALSAQSDESYENSLGRLAFLAFLSILFLLTASILSPTRGPFAESIARHPNGWIARLRLIWYPAGLLAPIALGILAALGYYYTALQLGGDRLLSTLVLALGVVLAHGVLERWIVVAHRRLAWDKAKEERRARLEAGETTESSASIELPDDPEIELAAVDQQTRSLVRTLLTASTIVGLWFIWSSALPALGFLDDVSLWDYQATGPDGNPLTRTITLEHVALAVAIVSLTLIAARDLPGALELTVLAKLPFAPGERYAVRTICQYIIVAIGFLTAFQAVGVGWSQVQWLVAAVSVGLGFGLQEIFANFVSGIILLFERPVRVGDVVTIGDVSGVVTRIRMRATTVRNWERKELIVPNKEFITGRLLNWTLTDAVNRIAIEVGIAYGSDVDRARSLLLRVATEHPLVLDDPAPTATFERFGDSALILTLRCFLPDLDNRLTVTHELHAAINARFERAEIEIAYPQRDLRVRSIDAPLVVTRPSPRVAPEAPPETPPA